MIAGRVHHATGEPSASPDVKAVGKLVGLCAQGAQPGHQRRNPVAFLDAQFRGAGDAQFAPRRRENRHNRQLVDDGRNGVGAKFDHPDLTRGDTDASDRLTLPDVGLLDLDFGPEFPEDFEQGCAGRIQADVLDRDL